MADHVFWWFIIKYVSDTEKGSILDKYGNWKYWRRVAVLSKNSCVSLNIVL